MRVAPPGRDHQGTSMFLAGASGKTSLSLSKQDVGNLFQTEERTVSRALLSYRASARHLREL